MTEQDGNRQDGGPPAEIAAFLAKIGPRQLTPAEARELNLLRLKHGLPAAGADGIAAGIADDGNEKG